MAKKAYRKLSRRLYPDRPGGSHEQMTKLNICKELVLIDCDARAKTQSGRSADGKDEA